MDHHFLIRDTCCRSVFDLKIKGQHWSRAYVCGQWAQPWARAYVWTVGTALELGLCLWTVGTACSWVSG